VIRKPGASLTEAELIAWARETMAAYKYPRTVRFVDAMPMTSTGKILKRELREQVRATTAVPTAAAQAGG
jgi:long-chain acyl-CoA synthetase